VLQVTVTNLRRGEWQMWQAASSIRQPLKESLKLADALHTCQHLKALMLTKLNTMSRHNTCHSDRPGADFAVDRAAGMFLDRSLDWVCDQNVQLQVLQMRLFQEML